MLFAIFFFLKMNFFVSFPVPCYFLLFFPPGQNLRLRRIIWMSNPILWNCNFQSQTICFNQHFLIQKFSFFLCCSADFFRHELIWLILICWFLVLLIWFFQVDENNKKICYYFIVCLFVGSTSCEFRFKPFSWLPLARSFLRKKLLDEKKTRK